MESSFDFKIVEFDKWCYKCKFRNVDENTYPCDTCLSCPTNLNSTRPTRFEEAKTKPIRGSGR